MAEWKRLERLSNVKEPVKEPCRCILLEQSRWKTAKGDAGEGPIVEGDGIKLCCRTVPLEAGGKLPIQGVGWARSQGWLLGDVREFTWPGAREGDESRLAPGSWLVSPGCVIPSAGMIEAAAGGGSGRGDGGLGRQKYCCRVM